MKYLCIAALMLGMLPAVAEAGGRFDRGHRYSGHRSSGFSVGVSVGFGSRWHGGHSRFHHGYSSSCYRPAPVYCPPVYRYRPVCYSPVVYSAPAVVYSPPVYYSAPAYYSAPPVYYTAPACEPRYYSEARVYYYNR